MKQKDWDDLPLLTRIRICLFTIRGFKQWRKRRAIDKARSVLWLDGSYSDEAERLREISDKMWNDAVPQQKQKI